MKVPKTAEGTLGIHLHDFIFESEILEGQTVRSLSIGIKINEKGPEPKKPKVNDQSKTLQLGGISNQGGIQTNIASSSKGPQHQKAAVICNSAPPKLQGIEEHEKLINQKSTSTSSGQPSKYVAPLTQNSGQPPKNVDPLSQNSEDNAEKVHIPDTFVDSDVESDTLSEKLRRIDAYNDEMRTGVQVNEISSNHKVWFMEEDSNAVVDTQKMNLELQFQNKISPKNTISPREDVKLLAGNTQDGRSEMEGVVFQSQESVLTNDGQADPMGGVADISTGKIPVVEEVGPSTERMKKEEKPKMPQVERRSESLKGEIHLTTQEKNEDMAKKRNLEGNRKTTHALADVENIVLHSLAKDMGVLVVDNDFASFDMLKELERARNCLHSKQLNKIVPSNCLEIVEFVPNDNHSNDIICSNVDSDVEEMLIQQSLEKNKFGRKKKFSFSPG